MLSSRPAQASSEDVRDLVSDNGAAINIIDNTVVDPPLFSLTLDLADGKQVPLLLHRAERASPHGGAANRVRSGTKQP